MKAESYSHLVDRLFVPPKDGDGQPFLSEVPEGDPAVLRATAHHMGLSGVPAQARHAHLFALGAGVGGRGGVGGGAHVQQLQLSAHVGHAQLPVHKGRKDI